MAVTLSARPGLWKFALAGVLMLSACAHGLGPRDDRVFAPGVNRMASAEDGVAVGHRLVDAGEYELALKSFSRAALDRGGTDAEILTGMGTANLGLGRLNQAERLLRIAVEKEAEWPELYNNLGVVLMEQGRAREASRLFRKAYALDNGGDHSIRDNLRLSLSKLEKPDSLEVDNNKYKLVRRGTGDYLIRRTP